MGLPMFREPKLAESKIVAKAAATVPLQSGIRRQHSVRYTSRNDRESTPSSRSRPRLHRNHDRLFGPNARRSSGERHLDLEASANLAHAEASQRRRFETGRATLRDALSYEHPHHSTDMRGARSPSPTSIRPLPSTLPHNALRRSQQRTAFWQMGAEASRSGLRTSRVGAHPSAYIPSSRYSSRDRSSRSNSNLVDHVASLTPRFPPAYNLTDIDSATWPEQLPRDERSRVGGTADGSMTSEVPPLRPIVHGYSPRPYRRVRPGVSSHQVVDGLGDRWRSVSPNDDSWATLLATLPPDERLPSSASASFCSDEDTVYREHLTGTSAAPINATANMHLVRCENADSEFSGVDEILSEIEIAARDMRQQQAAPPGREAVEAAEWRSDSGETFSTRDARRFDWGRF